MREIKNEEYVIENVSQNYLQLACESSGKSKKNKNRKRIKKYIK